ncbi:hypothetical protein EVAR_53453_1 [Eumeta japonica]|uniref:Uncharacterized protein n=1 Tax=Eumeta variegata TaxID=151549 RepID=A0A4C1XSY4_EUMVA|nr:hypothetical protein EVAR_53453_1 [Eumeta japonica]
MKTVRKPVKKAINVSLRKLVLQLEEKLPLFFKHVATITHQYQTISELKKKLTDNEVLIHIDFKPGHGKGAPDGVGGTLKRTADKAIAEGQDIVDLSSLKNILLARCSSIILFEVTTANIAEIEDLVKQSQTITAFRGTQKIRQFVFTDVLEFRSLSCSECEGKCKHFHLARSSKGLEASIRRGVLLYCNATCSAADVTLRVDDAASMSTSFALKKHDCLKKRRDKCESNSPTEGSVQICSSGCHRTGDKGRRTATDRHRASVENCALPAASSACKVWCHMPDFNYLTVDALKHTTLIIGGAGGWLLAAVVADVKTTSATDCLVFPEARIEWFNFELSQKVIGRERIRLRPRKANVAEVRFWPSVASAWKYSLEEKKLPVVKDIIDVGALSMRPLSEQRTYWQQHDVRRHSRPCITRPAVATRVVDACSDKNSRSSANRFYRYCVSTLRIETADLHGTLGIR